MGITLLELVKNRFPFTFPPDAAAFEVLLIISEGQVGGTNFVVFPLILTLFFQPPRLEDEAGISWSREMKDFISQA